MKLAARPETYHAASHTSPCQAPYLRSTAALLFHHTSPETLTYDIRIQTSKPSSFALKRSNAIAAAGTSCREDVEVNVDGSQHLNIGAAVRLARGGSRHAGGWPRKIRLSLSLRASWRARAGSESLCILSRSYGVMTGTLVWCSAATFHIALRSDSIVLPSEDTTGAVKLQIGAGRSEQRSICAPL